MGWLFAWKNVVLGVTIFASIIIYRPFCKYICPLGAVYSVFNPISVFRYQVDKDKCIDCGACARACKMNVNPVENANSTECIRCGACKSACPTCAISSGCGWGRNTRRQSSRPVKKFDEVKEKLKELYIADKTDDVRLLL